MLTLLAFLTDSQSAVSSDPSLPPLLTHHKQKRRKFWFSSFSENKKHMHTHISIACTYVCVCVYTTSTLVLRPLMLIILTLTPTSMLASRETLLEKAEALAHPKQVIASL